ncbi:MAG: dihydrofolate reductase family protein [Gammaproteobacteria bacterium]|nr:dihydrofolate reductase family protein [Gammaproteobacteria bacterium]
MHDLLQLYPPPTTSLPLERLYLEHPLHRLVDDATALVYSNFITSLDGRIALPHPGQATHGVPAAIGNARDWRLYQELAAQSDLLVTSARYFRQYAAGEAQDTLPVGNDERFADLRAWRLDQGLNAQPDIAVFSASLDIPAVSLQAYRTRRVHVLTGNGADPARMDALRAQDVEVHSAGAGTNAEGGQAIRLLQNMGYRRIYVIAGPSVFYTLVRAGVLQRLYLTLAHRILGGEDFDSLTWGSELQPAPQPRLRSLFYDAYAPDDAGQLLACYDFPAAIGP